MLEEDAREENKNAPHRSGVLQRLDVGNTQPSSSHSLARTTLAKTAKRAIHTPSIMNETVCKGCVDFFVGKQKKKLQNCKTEISFDLTMKIFKRKELKKLFSLRFFKIFFIYSLGMLFELSSLSSSSSSSSKTIILVTTTQNISNRLDLRVFFRFFFPSAERFFFFFFSVALEDSDKLFSIAVDKPGSCTSYENFIKFIDKNKQTHKQSNKPLNFVSTHHDLEWKMQYRYRSDDKF